VPEHERSHRRVDRVKVDPREAVGSVELQNPASLAAGGLALIPSAIHYWKRERYVR